MNVGDNAVFGLSLRQADWFGAPFKEIHDAIFKGSKPKSASGADMKEAIRQRMIEKYARR